MELKNYTVDKIFIPPSNYDNLFLPQIFPNQVTRWGIFSDFFVTYLSTFFFFPRVTDGKVEKEKKETKCFYNPFLISISQLINGEKAFKKSLIVKRPY